MILIQLSDFTGQFTLARSIQNDPLLQSYIDKYEPIFIKQILGATLGQEYITDKSQPTQDPIFVVIEDAFIQDDNSIIKKSDGLKAALLGLIFYKFVFETQTKHSQSGVTINQSQVANNNSPENAARFAEQRWNGALETIEAIQWYVTDFAPDDYPSYNGQTFTPEYSAFL
jgi:hypothetical protein